VHVVAKQHSIRKTSKILHTLRSKS